MICKIMHGFLSYLFTLNKHCSAEGPVYLCITSILYYSLLIALKAISYMLCIAAFTGGSYCCFWQPQKLQRAPREDVNRELYVCM